MIMLTTEGDTCLTTSVEADSSSTVTFWLTKVEVGLSAGRILPTSGLRKSCPNMATAAPPIAPANSDNITVRINGKA